MLALGLFGRVGCSASIVVSHMYSDPSIAKVQEDETLGGCDAVITPVVVFFRRA